MKIPNWLPCFGDLSFRGDCPKEDYVLSSVISRIRKDYPTSYGLVTFHVKNESKRTQGQIKADKIKGLTKGVSDIVIPGMPTLCLEIKRSDHTKSSWEDGQLQFLEAAQRSGAYCCVAFGYDAALEAIDHWIKLNQAAK